MFRSFALIFIIQYICIYIYIHNKLCTYPPAVTSEYLCGDIYGRICGELHEFNLHLGSSFLVGAQQEILVPQLFHWSAAFASDDLVYPANYIKIWTSMRSVLPDLQTVMETELQWEAVRPIVSASATNPPLAVRLTYWVKSVG